MLLARILRSMTKGSNVPASPVSAVVHDGPKVLNVGGNSKDIPIPKHYDGWNHLLLDIDATGDPDIVCDARRLDLLKSEQFDAIYCSHNFEHYYKHDGVKVLRGFLHVLKPDGFAEITVPDLGAVMRRCIEAELDLEDTLYQSAAGPISVREVLYGWSKKIEETGEDFYAHKTGFTPNSLAHVLSEAGFARLFMRAHEEAFEVNALAFKREPTPEQLKLLDLTP
jgi:SAM-dependent methyltransferase